MRPYLNSVLFCFFLAGQLFGQGGRISGTIHVSSSDERMPGLNVYLKNSNFGTITDGNGQFELNAIPEGQYQLVVSGIGYSTIEEKVEVVEGREQELQLEILEDIAQLPGVEVSSISLSGSGADRKNLPGAVHYLSSIELEKFKYFDVNRSLRNVPGVYFQEEDGFGLRPNIGLRGTGSERSSKITIMEDGVLSAPAPYVAPSAYYFPTIGRMSGIEVLKGNSQIKYGPYTTGGALNLISTPIPSEFKGYANIRAGSFGTRSVHTWVGNSHKNIAYVGETFQYGSNGFKHLPNGGDTGFDKKDYLFKFRVNTNPGARIYQSLTIKAAWAEEQSHETYLGLARQDFDEDPFQRYAASEEDLMTTNQRQFTARYTVQFSRNLEMNLTAYRNDFNRNWYKLDKIQSSVDAPAQSIASILDNPAGSPDAYQILKSGNGDFDRSVWLKSNNRDYYSQGIQWLAGWQQLSGEVKHKILVGARLHNDAMDRFQQYDYYRLTDNELSLTSTGAPGSESNRIETANAFASFIQYTLEWDRLTVVPGLRYESMTLERANYGKEDPERLGADLSIRQNQVNVFIPGIGINYALSSKWNLFAGVHKGFAPPGTTPDTDPEESVNYELGSRFSDGAYLKTELVFFHNNYQNLLGSDLAAAGGAGTTDLFNGGEAVTSGVEAGITYDLKSIINTGLSLPVQGTYTYTRAVFRNNFESDYDPWGVVEDGDFLPYVPEHQFALSMGVEYGRVGFYVNSLYVSAMRTVAGQESLSEVTSTDEQLTFDASLNYRLTPHIFLTGAVNNFTNSTYAAAMRPAGFRPGMPRMFLAGVRAQF